MSKVINTIKQKPIFEYVFILILFITISVLFAGNMGILDSGYHFIDDHEIIRINNDIINHGFIEALKTAVSDDLVWRYRPLFFIVRTIRAFLFGTNFYWWHLITAIECGATIGLSYIFARKMNTNIIPSLLFSFIFLIGSQDEIIWRMGTNENMGMFFLATSFLLTLCYFKSEKKIYKYLSIISVILLTLTKESFLLMVPSIIMFLFFLYLKESKEKKSLFVKALDFIKKYKAFIIISCLALIIGLLVIVFYVGLMESGYAGIDTSYSLGTYIRIILNVFLRDLKDYWLIFGILLGLLVYYIINKKNNGQLDNNIWQLIIVGLLMFAYSIGIEMVLYAKSGMFDRYKLPLLWILYLFLIVIQKESIKPLVHICIILFVISFLIFRCEQKGISLYQDANYYAYDGKKTTEMLNYVKDINNEKDKTVLTDCSWYEVNYSASVYLQLEEGVKEVYYLDEERENGDYKKIYGSTDRRIGTKDADIIITDNEKINYYDSKDYDIKNFSIGYVLIRK